MSEFLTYLENRISETDTEGKRSSILFYKKIGALGDNLERIL